MERSSENSSLPSPDEHDKEFMVLQRKTNKAHKRTLFIIFMLIGGFTLSFFLFGLNSQPFTIIFLVIFVILLYCLGSVKSSNFNQVKFTQQAILLQFQEKIMKRFPVNSFDKIEILTFNNGKKYGMKLRLYHSETQTLHIIDLTEFITNQNLYNRSAQIQGFFRSNHPEIEILQKDEREQFP